MPSSVGLLKSIPCSISVKNHNCFYVGASHKEEAAKEKRTLLSFVSPSQRPLHGFRPRRNDETHLKKNGNR